MASPLVFMKTDSTDKLDCTARVITPENIEFEYSLAGPFQRLPAFAFDLAIRALVFFALFLVLIFSSIVNPLSGTLMIIILLLTFFLFSWFYGIFFETRFNGRTLGKMVFKLRVISVDGRPINATQAALRNLLRLADMCFLLSLQVLDPESPPAFVIPTMLIGLIVMTLSPRLQRLGDLAAGTMVVSEGQRRSPWNLKPEDLRAFGLAELIPATFQVSSSLAQTTGLYMENRKRLSLQRRYDVAKHLADPLIQKFGLLADTSPDLLLCALYVRVFLSEQQRQQGMAQMRQTSAPVQPPPLRRSFTTSRKQVPTMAGQMPGSQPASPPPASTAAAPSMTSDQTQVDFRNETNQS